jgi:hypothetical protein
MKAIFVGAQGIRAGWRFAMFVFLLFGFSKLFFWLLTVLFHYQEHVGWFPTDFLIEGMLSFGAALLAAWVMSRIERRPFHEYGLSWNTIFGKHFWQGALWGFGASLLMVILLSAPVHMFGHVFSRQPLPGGGSVCGAMRGDLFV